MDDEEEKKEESDEDSLENEVVIKMKDVECDNDFRKHIPKKEEIGKNLAPKKKQQPSWQLKRLELMPGHCNPRWEKVFCIHLLTV